MVQGLRTKLILDGAFVSLVRSHYDACTVPKKIATDFMRGYLFLLYRCLIMKGTILSTASSKLIISKSSLL